MPTIKHKRLHYKRWYFVRAFVPGHPDGITTICFADDVEKAQLRVGQWLKEQGFDLVNCQVHLVLKNKSYKNIAIQLLKDKNYIRA